MNALASHEGYKPLNAEALIEAAPEYILVVQHDSEKTEKAVMQSVLSLPGVELTPAGKQSRVLVLDALRFLGFGPRTGKALTELADQLYPVSSAQ